MLFKHQINFWRIYIMTLVLKSWRYYKEGAAATLFHHSGKCFQFTSNPSTRVVKRASTHRASTNLVKIREKARDKE